MTDPNAFDLDVASSPAGVPPEFVKWVHDALEHMFDLAFLDRHARASCVAGRYAGGRALHEALQQAIKQLRPPASVSPHSPAWRIYHALNLRYAQGLTQAEAAAELGMSVRHFKRAQDNAIYTAAALLLEPPEDGAAPKRMLDPASGAGEFAPSSREFIRIDDLLRATLQVVEPLLSRQDTRIQLIAPPILPVVQADRILARQLLISALTWLIHDVSGRDFQARVDVLGHDVALRLFRPGDVPPAGDEELTTIRQLAGAMNVCAAVRFREGEPACDVLEIRLPLSETRCVLLVEDNVDAIGLVERYLERSGEFHLVSVREPGDALKHAIALRPACILLDVMMPEHDGWELLGLFKANPETAHIPVVISSVIRGYDLARALGAAAVLPKPYSAAQLIETLRSVTVQSASPLQATSLRAAASTD